MRGQLILATLFLPLLARATRPGVSNIGFHPRPGQAPPERAGFIDQDRRTGVLGDQVYACPIVLALGYKACPCFFGFMREQIVTRLGQMDQVAGDDWDLVFVSTDPVK